MVTAVFIPADTDLDMEVREVEQVEDLQSAVGGWFEPIDVHFLGLTIYVNEEGRVRRMPFNARASFLWWYHAPNQDLAMLMGDAIVVGKPNKAGDDTSVPTDLVERFTKEQQFALMLRIDGESVSLSNPASKLASIVQPMIHGDPGWVLSAVCYDDYWSALVWAQVLLERWPDTLGSKVLPVAELPDHLGSSFPTLSRKR